MKKILITLIFFFSFIHQPVMAADPNTGWWWNPAESGRGFSIEQQGNTIFYAAYLYDDSSNNAWYTALLTKNAAGVFTGEMNQFSDGQTLLGTYQPPSNPPANIGSITLAFDTPTTGTMTWPGGVVSIERFIFNNSGGSADLETGWWWNPAESGRGFSIEQQGDSIFYAGYLYDNTGGNAWYTALLTKNAAGVFTGTMNQFSDGQTLFGAYQAPLNPPADIGSIILTFDSTTTGTMVWPGGIVPIERFIFKAPPSLNQAAFRTGTSNYVFGLNSIANIKLAKAPSDTDYSRWAMLHDGSRYRLYFFKKSSNTMLYQFAFNPATGRYEYGFSSIPNLKITGAPADANPSSFAMLHDGNRYRLYMRGNNNPSRLYQFAFNPSTSNYEFGFSSINQINITGSPADVDLSRWAMLHDGTDYRFYAFRAGSNTRFYQYAFNGSSYAFGFKSINQLTLQGLPSNTNSSSFAMLHDGSNFRFYQQTQ